jgi:hypothetical protein
VRGCGGDLGLPFLGVEVERLGRERAVAAGLGRLGAFAVVVIVGDRFQTAFRGGTLPI